MTNILSLETCEESSGQLCGFSWGPFLSNADGADVPAQSWGRWIISIRRLLFSEWLTSFRSASADSLLQFAT